MKVVLIASMLMWIAGAGVLWASVGLLAAASCVVVSVASVGVSVALLVDEADVPAD